jgi:hypothetical protein
MYKIHIYFSYGVPMEFSVFVWIIVYIIFKMFIVSTVSRHFKNFLSPVIFNGTGYPLSMT